MHWILDKGDKLEALEVFKQQLLVHDHCHKGGTTLNSVFSVTYYLELLNVVSFYY